MEKDHYIFVYGTLMEGFGNNRLLQNLDSEFVSFGETVNRYRMFPLGGSIPGVTKPSIDQYPLTSIDKLRWRSLYRPVKGEIYKVGENILKHRLDVLEGHPSFYTRQLTDVKDFLQNDRVIQAWMYFILDDYAEQHSSIKLDEERCYCWRHHTINKKERFV